MTRNSLTILFAAVLCCTVLVTDGRFAHQSRADEEHLPAEVSFENDIDDDGDDAEEFRFLSGGGTGGSTATAINNLITQKQQMLESLRPQGGSTGTSTGSAASVIYVNAGSTGTATTTGTGTTSGSSGSGSSVAGVLLPQVIGAALQGGNTRRRRRPSNRNRNRNRNGNRNRNRNRNRGQNRNRKRAQVYLVRP